MFADFNGNALIAHKYTQPTVSTPVLAFHMTSAISRGTKILTSQLIALP